MRRYLPFAAFLLFLLPALACGSGTPTPKVSSGGGVLPTGTTVPAAPAASVGKVGDTVSLKSYAVSLHAKQDPATATIPAPSGKRLVAFDLTITALADNVAYNPLYATLKLADNTEASTSFFGPDPSLKSGTLAKGESARGWLAFEVATGAQPATLSYQILTFGGEGKIQFDVR
jgi:hypothetical protein